jgi:hypothetical protein
MNHGPSCPWTSTSAKTSSADRGGSAPPSWERPLQNTLQGVLKCQPTYCTLIAQLRKSLVINGAGESAFARARAESWNRTVISGLGTRNRYAVQHFPAASQRQWWRQPGGAPARPESKAAGRPTRHRWTAGWSAGPPGRRGGGGHSGDVAPFLQCRIGDHVDRSTKRPKATPRAHTGSAASAAGIVRRASGSSRRDEIGVWTLSTSPASLIEGSRSYPVFSGQRPDPYQPRATPWVWSLDIFSCFLAGLVRRHGVDQGRNGTDLPPGPHALGR